MSSLRSWVCTLALVAGGLGLGGCSTGTDSVGRTEGAQAAATITENDLQTWEDELSKCKELGAPLTRDAYARVVACLRASNDKFVALAQPAFVASQRTSAAGRELGFATGTLADRVESYRAGISRFMSTISSDPIEQAWVSEAIVIPTGLASIIANPRPTFDQSTTGSLYAEGCLNEEEMGASIDAKRATEIAQCASGKVAENGCQRKTPCSFDSTSAAQSIDALCTASAAITFPSGDKGQLITSIRICEASEYMALANAAFWTAEALMERSAAGNL